MIAEAVIETTKASKYLKWLCGHFKIKVPAEYTDTHGTVQFPFGRCEMQAKQESMFIRVEADDAESFERVKDVVGGHLERFAHKDSVQVVWTVQVEEA